MRDKSRHRTEWDRFPWHLLVVRNMCWVGHNETPVKHWCDMIGQLISLASGILVPLLNSATANQTSTWVEWTITLQTKEQTTPFIENVMATNFFGYFCLVQQTKSNDNKSVLAKGLENFSYTRLVHVPHALSIIRCTEKSWNKSPQWAMCYVNSRSMIKQTRKVSLLRIFWFIAGFLLSRIKKILFPFVSFVCVF